MTNREFCIARRKAELPAFLRVLRALPEARLDYKPDEKSKNAAQLAGVLIEEEAALAGMIDTGSINWTSHETRTKVADIVAAYEKNHRAVTERLEKMSDADWTKTASFVVPGMPPWEQPLSEFLWLFLFDAVHHRGQLSTYLRPMGGKVPSIYGPSADDPTMETARQ
ncbi:MAG: DinB family protein [Vicinamibacterales bacterium]